MPVMIEELQAEVAPPPAPPAAEEGATATEGLDERKLIEALAREVWCARRLLSD